MKDESARKLAVTLEHQYTQEGLTWDALKGVDRVKAQVLLEAGRQADCRVYLALLTFHESGEAEGGGGGYGYGRRHRRWDYDDEEDDPGQYSMGEIYDSSLQAEHWSDSEGKGLPIGALSVEQEEVLDPDAIKAVEPEEEFEGYTGNAGMTLDRWYRHGAIFLWPNRKHFEVLCGAGSWKAVEALEPMVKQLKKASASDAPGLRASCVEFAAAIIANWPENPYGSRSGYGDDEEERDPLPTLLKALAEPGLIKAYLATVATRDASADPGKLVLESCQKHGPATFQPELEVVFKNTTASSLARNIRLLEQLCTARARKNEGWTELCGALARATVEALQTIDQGQAAHDFRIRNANRAQVLAGLARSLLATDQFDLLSLTVEHTLGRPANYPLTEAHLAALEQLRPWIEKNVEQPCPPLSRWLASCREQLEALTAVEPQAPTDWRRSAAISCKCADCAALKQFLDDPNESVYHFRVREDRRSHLERRISEHHCDVATRTEKKGTPYALVCTKNSASHEARLKKYHQDREHLAMLRELEAKVPT